MASLKHELLNNRKKLKTGAEQSGNVLIDYWWKCQRNGNTIQVAAICDILSHTKVWSFPRLT